MIKRDKCRYELRMMHLKEWSALDHNSFSRIKSLRTVQLIYRLFKTIMSTNSLYLDTVLNSRYVSRRR